MGEPARATLGPDDLEEGELRSYSVGGRRILVARVDGRLRAMDDWCNHSGCLLSEGRVERNMIVCPCHEIGFDLDSGRNVTSPGIAGDQPVFHLERVEGQLVLIGLSGVK